MLRKFAAVLTSLLLAVGLSVIAVAAPASATHPTISGTAVCNPATGKYDITWRVTGDTGYPNETATIKQQSVATAPDLVGKTVKNTGYVEGVQAGVAAGTNASFKVWVQWTNHSAGDLVTQTGSVKVPSAPCYVVQNDSVDCTNATVYLGSKLTNGNYINMTVRINGQDKQMSAYVDIRQQQHPQSESGLILRIQKADGGEIFLPISNAQRDSGILTFNYAAYLTGSWTVKWVQFDGHNWHFGEDGNFLTCGTQEASAGVVLTDANCTTGQTVAKGSIVGATWGEITYNGSNYSVTATALPGYAFPGNQTTKTFTGSLSPPTDGPECHPETPVATPTAKAITECGTYGVVNVPASTDKVIYTLTGNGTTGINTVTATAVAPYVLTGYPAGGWQFNLGSYYDCTIALTISYVQDCPVDPTNTWRVYNPTEDTVVVTYGAGLTHNATPGYSTFETARAAETVTIAWGASGSGTAPGTASATAGSDLGANDPACITLAEPVAPTLTTVTECGVYGSVVPADTVGVDYDVVFDQETGEYTVTATPKDGYFFADDKTEIVYEGTVGAYYECVIDTDATIAYGECTWNEDGTANNREVAITFDNTKSNVDVPFEVAYFPEYNQVVPAGEKVTFSVANIWPKGGGYTVIAGTETFELTIEPCDEPVKPEPKTRDEVIVSSDCETTVATVTTTTYTTDWVFDTETGQWVEGDEVAGTPVITTRPMTPEETKNESCYVTVTDPAASTCLSTDDTEHDSWIRVELNANVQYTIDGVVVTEEYTSVTPGAHVVVATALNGYTLKGANPEPDDWTDTTHTWNFVAADTTDCDPPTLSQVLPTYSSQQLGCTANGSYTIGAEFGDVTWTVDGEPTEAGTYTVTEAGTVTLVATPTDPTHGFDDAWTQGSTPIVLTFERPTEGCDNPTLAEVLPEYSSTPLTCTAAGSYTVGAEFGDVTWTANGAEIEAGTYPVTKPGTVILEATPTDPEDTFADEWTDEPITLAFAFPGGTCDKGLLALTGAAASWAPVWGAAVLMLTGLGIFLLRRKNTAQ